MMMSPADCILSAPTCTNPDGSTVSCEAVPVVRATPAAPSFYLSLEDDMMRIFGGGRIERVMDTLGWKEGEAINHAMVTKAIERARKQVEYNNFSIRKEPGGI